MINFEDFIQILKKKKINFFTGVPDSLLKIFSNYLQEIDKKKHILAVNEGNAVSIAAGNYLATGKLPCVYLQNSGLGNSINPLVSLTHEKVYSIPIFLLIGWRGSPFKNDEPQHNEMGRLTPKILKLLNIKYCILKKKTDLKKVEKLITFSIKNKRPVAALIPPDIFSSNRIKKIKPIKKNPGIETKYFINSLLSILNKNSKIISSTGYTSRYLLKARKDSKKYFGTDFYLVGSMGHTSSISLGYSIKSKKNIICLDGDGSMLMHLGATFTLVNNSKKNIKYILLNNNLHESVGTQKTEVNKIDLKLFSKAVGFSEYVKISNKRELSKLKKINLNKKIFFEITINNPSHIKLPRPQNLKNIKKLFMLK